jgi:hypothetical protein
MDFKEYINKQCPIDKAFIAERMWPTNKGAKSYLSKKLSGERPWTEKDNDLAKKVINEYGHELTRL